MPWSRVWETLAQFGRADPTGRRGPPEVDQAIGVELEWLGGPGYTGQAWLEMDAQCL